MVSGDVDEKNDDVAIGGIGFQNWRYWLSELAGLAFRILSEYFQKTFRKLSELFQNSRH